MEIVNIHDAKTNLSRLLKGVERGESFVIAKAGIPIAKVVPLDAPEQGKTSRFGFMKGKIKVPDDFDRMGSSEIDALFSGHQ